MTPAALDALEAAKAAAIAERGAPLAPWMAWGFMEDGYEPAMAAYLAAGMDALPSLLASLRAASALLQEAETHSHGCADDYHGHNGCRDDDEDVAQREWLSRVAAWLKEGGPR